MIIDEIKYNGQSYMLGTGNDEDKGVSARAASILVGVLKQCAYLDSSNKVDEQIADLETELTTGILVERPIINVGSSVSITSANEVRYTLNGSTPTASSTRYTGVFTPVKNCTIKAVAIKDGKMSNISSATFELSPLAEVQFDDALVKSIVNANYGETYNDLYDTQTL